MICVYVLIKKWYDLAEICGVYSSWSNAEAAMLEAEGRKRLSKKLWDPVFGYEIQAYEINKQYKMPF